MALPTLVESSWRSAGRGVTLAVGLAFAAQVVSSWAATSLMDGGASPVSPVLLAIIFGILWRHCFGVGQRTQWGLQWMLQTFFRIGIALVGLKLTVRGLTDVGFLALPVVAVCVTAALLVSKVIGRLLGLSPGLQHLLAVGSAVCGCTAIIAMAPVIKARALETSTALTCTVLVGSLGMMCYPWLADAFFGRNSLAVGIFLGSAIHDTSQVIGAALIHAQQFGSADVVGVASATKLFRNLSLAVLLPIMVWSSHRRYEIAPDEGTAARCKQVIPGFIVAFLALVFLRALGDSVSATSVSVRTVWLQTLSALQFLSELFLTCGMTAIGLSVSISQVYQSGYRPLCAALVIAAITAACSLSLTYALFHVLN